MPLVELLLLLPEEPLTNPMVEPLLVFFVELPVVLEFLFYSHFSQYHDHFWAEDGK